MAVVGLPRTGSTLMCEILRQHPAIVSAGELFDETSDGRLRVHKAAFQDDEFCHDIRQRKSVYTYCDSLTSKAHKCNRELSMKVLDMHSPHAWSWILNNCKLLIHIRQFNPLESLVSLKLALRSGLWHVYKKEHLANRDMSPIRIEPKEIMDWCRRLDALSEILTTFPHRVMSFDLEYVSRNPQQVADEIFLTLGLSLTSINIKQMKIEDRELPDIISNIKELRDTLHGTRYQSLLW